MTTSLSHRVPPRRPRRAGVALLGLERVSSACDEDGKRTSSAIVAPSMRERLISLIACLTCSRSADVARERERITHSELVVRLDEKVQLGQVARAWLFSGLVERALARDGRTGRVDELECRSARKARKWWTYKHHRLLVRDLPAGLLGIVVDKDDGVVVGRVGVSSS